VDTAVAPTGKIAAWGGQIEGRGHELQACKLLTVWITPVDKRLRAPDVYSPDGSRMCLRAEPDEPRRRAGPVLGREIRGLGGVGTATQEGRLKNHSRRAGASPKRREAA
jgi:hypothetical protein